jgi:hypothetical protein
MTNSLLPHGQIRENNVNVDEVLAAHKSNAATKKAPTGKLGNRTSKLETAVKSSTASTVTQQRHDITSSVNTGIKMMQLDNKIAMCQETEAKWVDGLLKYFPEDFDKLEHLNHDEFVAWAQTNGKQSGPLRAICSWLDKYKKEVADLESALCIPSVVNVNVATATITSNVASVTTVSARNNDEYDTYNLLTDNVTQTEDV